MNQRRFPIVLAFLLFFPSKAIACAGYDVVMTQTSGVSYNPTDVTDTPLVVQLAASAAPLPNECENLPVRIEGLPGDPQPFIFAGGGGLSLSAEITSSQDAAFAFSSLQLSADARARLVRGQTVTFQAGRFPAGSFLRSGAYSSTIRVIAGTTEVSEVLNVIVEPAVLLKLSSADGVEEILLNGDPQAGTTGSTVFFYRTNTSLRVSAASLNSGALVHQRGATFGRIPYVATLDGNALNLSTGPTSVDFDLEQTGLQSRTISVEIPPAGPLAAGRYEDVITFSFAPY